MNVFARRGRYFLLWRNRSDDVITLSNTSEYVRLPLKARYFVTQVLEALGYEFDEMDSQGRAWYVLNGK